MREEINVIRCTCDVCKKRFDVKNPVDNPLKELVLPMRWYDETGRFNRVKTEKVDVCRDCLEQMERALSEHYDMSTISYVGVCISKKGGEDNA